jgi:hypothetical protein
VARLTAQQKVERDARIVADRAAGLRWPTVARRHELSERQCQQIVKEHRAAQPPFESHDPVDAVMELVEQLDSLVEKFALVAEETAHDAVRVGALRSQAAAMEQRFTVMHTLGLLPPLDLVRLDVDMRRVMDTAVKVLKRHEVGAESSTTSSRPSTSGSRGPTATATGRRPEVELRPGEGSGDALEQLGRAREPGRRADPRLRQCAGMTPERGGARL